MSKKYIKVNNEAPALKLGTIAFWYMFIDFYNLPEWVLGVWAAISIIITIAFIYRIATEKGVDLLGNDGKQ